MAEILDILSEKVANRKPHGMTLQSLLISLSVSLGLFILQLLLFSCFRKRFREIYEPKAFNLPRQIRVAPAPSSFFSWIPATLSLPLEKTKLSAGLDAYFFLRLILFLICFTSGTALLLIPILIPLHFLASSANSIWSERLLISNISPEHNIFLTAHLVLCIIVVIVSLFAFYSELQSYYYIRAEWTLQEDVPFSSTTLLIKGVYPEFRSHSAVEAFFSSIPGKITRVWFNRDYRELSRLARQQRNVLQRLEYLETWLIKKCQKLATTKSAAHEESLGIHPRWRVYIDESNCGYWTRYRLNALSWFKSELSRINSRVFLLQSQEGMFEPVNSCFVQFDSRLSCFMAYHSIQTSHGKSRTQLGASYTDQVHPNDIVWSNLSKATYLERFLHVLAVVLDYTLIFGWAIPIALVSMVTQVETLSQMVPQFGWLLQFPQVSRMMSSIVSPLVLSWLTSQVPHLFRALARLKGYPSEGIIEKDVQKYLFLFLFVQLFLIVTLATGLPSLVARMLVNTSEGAITLANSLPRATNFFISYLVASFLMSSGGALLHVEALLSRIWQGLWHVSPRSRLNAYLHFPSLPWGSLYPLLANICSITLTYALVSPLILLYAIAGYAVMFLAYKYCIIYCHVPKCNADGEYYPRAMFQLLSGIYCQEISLLGTLLLRNLPIHATIAAALIVATVFAHYYLKCLSLNLEVRLPLSTGEKTPDTNMTSTTVVDLSQHSPPPRDDFEENQINSLFYNLETNYLRLSKEQQAFVSDTLYEHPILHLQRPCVWLPRDAQGVAKDEVTHLQNDFSDMRASCIGADLNDKGHIILRQCPPDFDVRCLMKT